MQLFKRLKGLTLLLAAACSLQAQLVVDTTQTVEWYVQNVLLGGGVTATNITFNGQPADEINTQCGFFDSQNANVGMESGMILSSGGVLGENFAGNTIGAVGPNNSGSTTTPFSGTGISDNDLVTLANDNINDAAVLEFDFVPTGDTLRFNYVFASEEYPEYVNSFNDAFGFFLAGPGITGTFSAPAAFPGGSINIALVPGTNTPVTIDNVNNGNDGTTGPCVNCEYYIHNGNGFDEPWASDTTIIQYDGLTTVLEAFAIVQCGETYHIKLAVGDALDSAFDSAVFLQEGSFQSSLAISAGLFSSIGPGIDGVLYENCGFGVLEFTRSAGIEEEALVELEITGIAENGVDFTTIPESFIFPAGDSLFTMEVSAIIDGIFEGTETATLTITNTSESNCAGSITSEFVFSVVDDPTPLQIEIEDAFIDCGEIANIAPVVTGGYGQYSYEWSNGAETSFIDASPGITTSYYVTVTDTCNAGSISDSVLVTVPVYPPVTVEIADTTGLICLQSTILSPEAVGGGDGTYQYSWTENGEQLANTSDFEFTAASSTEVVLTVTDGCGMSGSDEMFISVPDVPITLAISPDTTICADGFAFIDLTVFGGEPPYDIEWEHGIEDLTQLLVSPEETQEYVAVIRDQCNTEERISTNVLVSHSEAAAIWSPSDYHGVEVRSNSRTFNADTLFLTWYMGDGDMRTDESFSHMYTENVDQTVDLHVINEIGCMDSTSFLVEAPPLLFVPTSFTPNGDGVNDIFRVIGDGVVEYELYIFNRWGQQIFYTADVDQGWNGRGDELSSHYAGNSNYGYRIRARLEDGERLDLHGFVTVIR